MSSIIRPLQDIFRKHLFKLFDDFNLPTDIDFINETPVLRINPYKFVWEVRQDAGLYFDKNDPIQKQLVVQVRNTFGAVGTEDSSSQDKEIPLKPSDTD
jgi:hypothetical protein